MGMKYKLCTHDVMPHSHLCNGAGCVWSDMERYTTMTTIDILRSSNFDVRARAQ